MFPSRDIVNRVRAEYPAGTRVELVCIAWAEESI